MSRSYIISPSLEERIQASWLVVKFPELGEKPYVWSFHWDDLESEILENPYTIPYEVQVKVLRLLDSSLYWRFQTKADDVDLFWNPIFEELKRVNADLNDIALWTWFLLPSPQEDTCYDEAPEFDKWELQNWEQYWFSSALDMIMCLSAYRSRDVLQYKRNQYEWVNSKWIRNVITACEHGDPKFFQYDENIPNRVISPFWNEVQFSPRNTIWNMSHVYHSHEPDFFATFFRYAWELWKIDEIMGKNAEQFSAYANTLPASLWNYSDAWWTWYGDTSNFLFRVAYPIWGVEWKIRNTHTHPYAPNSWEWFIEFQMWDNQELLILDASWNVIIKYFPEDCEHLLKWILHQCAYWHGRTSKHQIIRLVNFYYSWEFEEQRSEL